MSDAKIRRITKLMNELNADGDVKNSGLESAYTSNTYAVSTFVQTTHTGNVSITGNTSVTDTIQDAQGNVRALERNGITSTPYTFPSGSSGKYFSCNASGLTINIDAANIAAGEIFTFWANPDLGNVTIAWTNMTNDVYIAGDTNSKGTNGNLTLASGGLCTILCDATARMIFNGNVS